MNITTLYNYAEDIDVQIETLELEDVNALSLNTKHFKAIAIDENKFDDTAELKTSLAHELGHHATCSFYNIDNHLDVRSKHEYRADKWAIERLLPKEEMQEALECGVVEVWELAEYFEVTEELVKKAMWLYFDIIIL